jgi:hypothetical protein
VHEPVVNPGGDRRPADTVRQRPQELPANYHQHANAVGYSAHVNSVSNRQCHANGDGDADPNTDAHTHAHTHADAYSNTDAYAYRYRCRPD